MGIYKKKAPYYQETIHFLRTVLSPKYYTLADLNINTIIETGSEEGMIDMNRSLAELVRKGEVTVEDAYERAFDQKTFERYL